MQVRVLPRERDRTARSAVTRDTSPPCSGIREVTFGLWRRLVARVVRDDEVAGSNPVSPTHVLYVLPLLR